MSKQITAKRDVSEDVRERDASTRAPSMKHSGDGSKGRNPQGDADWDALLHALNSTNGVTRARARYGLVALGERSCRVLKQALHHPHEQVRWEAAKALAAVHCPDAAPDLVERLTDEDSDVRWLAAEALVSLGRQGLPSLFQALMVEDESPWLRQGAHHVLRRLPIGQLATLSRPVLDAIENVAAAVTLPVAARNALEALHELTVRELRAGAGATDH